MTRVMITKNSIVEIQILLVNHKSRPIKSNSSCQKTIYGIKGKNIHFGTFSQASSVKLTFYPLHFTSLLNLTKILHTLHKLHTHDNCNQNWTKDIYIYIYNRRIKCQKKKLNLKHIKLETMQSILAQNQQQKQQTSINKCKNK